MPAFSALRFVVHGLFAMTLYSGYRYMFSSTQTEPTALTSTHTSGSLGRGATLPDGRTTISRRTVAIADLHGDYQHALNVLTMASLISSSSTSTPPTWTGGHDLLVSTGDIVDRGDDTIPLYRLFISLRSQAASAGGEVRNCLGNHEFMNALGDWRYITKGDVDSFGGVEKRRAAMSATGWIGQEWLNNYNVTHTISLLPESHPQLPANYTPPRISFVHGGITPEYASFGIDYINSVGKSFLLKALSSTNPETYLPPNTTPEERDLYSEHGPLWYRGFATDPTPLACSNSHLSTTHLNVSALVMGHTPNFDGFITRCNNSILLIDTGISRAYGGQQSALIIDFNLIPQPSSPHLWKQQQTLTALYRSRPPKIISSSTTNLWL
ncbi:Serine-threonine protein phosphatase [Pseudozyma hubeiensis]|nr:Serine-threonine protein phosphatase [Pseudozyma hubeiensis]